MCYSYKLIEINECNKYYSNPREQLSQNIVCKT